ncbi:sensor domain-containing diguanylate cyclase [Lysinibacillus sp. LZ02]|uniref:sensor domain-containing diguanylate cyclase n=1 Tax=Lysinibacillus sp. LZ02 TaxID=3420668 RepID=UPI003D35CE54
MLYVIIIALFIIGYLYRRYYLLKKQLDSLQTVVQAVEHSRDIFYYCDLKPQMQYRYLSSAINRMLGEHEWQAHMQNPQKYYDILHPDDIDVATQKLNGAWDYNEPLLVRLQNTEGQYIWFEEYATPVYKNGEMIAIHGVYRNVGSKVAIQQELEYKAMHDHLTGTKNRACFDAQMALYNNKESVPIGMIVCDLDNLKCINDKQGHKMGDAYIQQSANIIREAVGSKGIVARIGGDEFSIMMPHVTSEIVDDVMEQIRYKVQQFNHVTEQFSIQISIGSSYSPYSFGQMEELFEEADRVMYREKQKKKTICH